MSLCFAYCFAYLFLPSIKKCVLVPYETIEKVLITFTKYGFIIMESIDSTILPHSGKSFIKRLLLKKVLDIEV